jgi:hypothetical protein
VQAAGKDVGEITSAAMLPSQEGEIAVALGYVRKEAGAPGATVEIGTSKAQVGALPFTL